jgi:predicted alpha-1,2-mannosidase
MKYKTFYPYYCLLIILSASFISTSAQDVVKYVQPMSGTAAATTPAALKHGSGFALFANTIPAVTIPFAMTQWTPQTQTTENKCIPPYYYKDSLFTGFRGSHWLSGSCTQDYGSVTIMPVTGKLQTASAQYATRFYHQDEQSSPYAYKVNLPAYHLTAAVTATTRCGLMEFTSQNADSLYLLITPNSDFGEGYVRIDASAGEIAGYNPVHRIYQGWGKQAGFNGYFVIKVEKAIASKGTFAEASLFAIDSIKNQKNIGAFVGFKMGRGERLRIRIGTSFSSIEGARKNLNAEMPNYDFDAVTNSCKAAWEKALKQILVETGREKDKVVFYTSMYHLMQHPRLFNDVDGTYPKFSSQYQLDKLRNGNYYDDFSLWDIYRAQLPLIELLQPGLMNNLVQSLILKGQQGGWLPIFPCWNSYTSEMIGDHITSVIASAYLKGIRNYDINEAYRLLRQNAFSLPANKEDYVEGKGRRALDSYMKYGYIPLEDSVPDAFHKKEQVSRTLEYAYDDYALAQFAKVLGKTDDYKNLVKRAGNYASVFDGSTGFVRGRYANGSWVTPFNADAKESYITEGTPRQYTFYVPHDVPGLARLMGGPKALENALDSLFDKNEYWHGNEPGHQIPFMYNYTASPWKTQKVVRSILAEEYSDGPGGLSGNDDAGQMSAWYVFASIGFYPLNPVSGEYLLCTPLFDKITMNLPGNKPLIITCNKKTKDALYIEKVKLNGRLHSKNFVSYTDLIKGGTLEIYLTDQTGNWASDKKSRPSGLSLQ